MKMVNNIYLRKSDHLASFYIHFPPVKLLWYVVCVSGCCRVLLPYTSIFKTL